MRAFSVAVLTQSAHGKQMAPLRQKRNFEEEADRAAFERRKKALA